MDAEPSTATNQEQPLHLDVPMGDHPLEVAARRGLGPLSPVGNRVWHGESVPCVSCGQLVRRGAIECEDCGQNLSDEMLEKMRAHAGPWYVLEHLRPFPGVSLERIIKQIRRGLITETSIVRGPSTDYQWRFAVETPGLCRYFGKCWHCHHDVPPSDTYCPSCLSFLSFEKPVDPRALPRADLTMTPVAAATAEASPAVAPAWTSSRSSPGPSAGHSAVGRPSPMHAESRSTLLSEPMPNRPPTGTAVSRDARAEPAPGKRSHAMQSSLELARLADAVQRVEHLPKIESRSLFGPGWIAGIFLAAGLIALILVAGLRARALSSRTVPTQPVARETAPAPADQSIP